MSNCTTKEQTNKQFVLNAVLSDGTILDEIYNPRTNHAQFVILKDGKISVAENYVDPESSTEYVPLVDKMIKQDVITLPMGIGEAYDTSLLLKDVEQFIYKYVDVGPAFNKISARYVLMTWLYDQFPKVPYIRIMGPFGVGKSRFLSVMRVLCYHSLNLGVTPTLPAIFRSIDKYGGTALIDEANFGGDNEFSGKFTQVMNNCYDRDGIVHRVGGKSGEYSLDFFKAFGPKIFGSHQPYKDGGLESRLITHYSQQTTRVDISTYTPSYKEWPEAIDLQKRLLAFRMCKIGKIEIPQRMECISSFEGRLQEILMPLLLVTGETSLPDEIKEYAEEIADLAREDRLHSDEGLVLSVLVELNRIGKIEVSPGEVNSLLAAKGITMPPRKIGSVLRILGLKGRRVNRGMIYVMDKKRLQAQAKLFGI